MKRIRDINAPADFFGRAMLILLIHLLAFSMLQGEEILYSWDFATPGNTEGWRPTNDLSAFSVDGGALRTASTGADPYMHGPVINFDAASFPYLKIRMRVSAGTNAEFFWVLQGMQHEEAGYEQPFSILPDNLFHDYLVYVGKHDKWKNKIIRLRLDPTMVSGAEIAIDYIQVLSIGPRLEIKTLAPDRLLPKADSTFNIGCVIENAGDKTIDSISSQLSLAAGLSFQTADSVQFLPALAPAERHEFNWAVMGDSPGAYSAAVTITAANLPVALETAVSFNVEALFPELPLEIPDIARVNQFNSDIWIMENPHIRLAFDRFRNFRFYTAKSNQWMLLGTSQPISSIEYRSDSGEERLELIPDHLEIMHESPDSVQLKLSGQRIDAGSATWQFRFDFGLACQSAQCNLQYQVMCSQNRELLLFTGPSVYLGEGSFGEQFQEAILPGVEWLVEGEHSSNTLDAHPPANLRFAPHPLKITAPIAALNVDGVTTGLLWNPHQPWDGINTYPALEFSVPNWLEGQKNHKIGMMLPSIPEYLSENLQSPTKPYPLQPRKTLTMSASLFALPGKSALDAFDIYFQLYGIPEVQPMIRSFEEEIILCREGFQSVWSESQQGWQHAMGTSWQYEPYPGFAYLQLLDAASTDDPVVKTSLNQRVNLILNKILRTRGEAYLANRGGCHIAGWQFPFYVGHLDGAINGMKNEATACLNSQHSSGGWAYAGPPDLGESGTFELGTCALNTFLMLYYYQISADERFWEAAEKALQFMRQFTVPRGAQTWEVPLHTPDILAAGYAVRAYVTAYRITGNASYLEQARYWARTGLQFIYLWTDPQIAAMPFATIPVLGATFYTYPWFGKAVQWCGLVYAHALYQLAEIDTAEPLWRVLAEGITRSAMVMQHTSVSNKGTYPDAWDMLSNSPQPVDINPEDIVKNVLFMMGKSPELQSSILRTSSEALHLTSAAQIREAALDTIDRTLHFECDFHAGDTCHVLIAGLKRAPGTVVKGDLILKKANDVDAATEGWQYTESGFLILKITRADTLAVSIEITGIKTNLQKPIRSGESMPSRFYLGQNYPNPFSTGNATDSGVTTIEYGLPKACDVKIQIYDLRGRLVKTLLRANKAAGTYRLEWNGRDSQQIPTASGLYFCRMDAGDQSLLRKLVIVK
ncbi:T9SS type A sorting domain-containing protein [candidate division KSB1 bacterium]|nr:T9SS type A sorting domain-containing protein [candidate division KSB1 bacterium]